MKTVFSACLFCLAAFNVQAQAPAATPSAAPAAATPAAAPAAAPAPYGQPITLEQARRAVAAGEAEARRMGWILSFAVVEPSGELVHFSKMDGAGYGSIDVSQAKARSAARFGRPTKLWSDSLAAGRMGSLAIPDIVPIEGGVPLVVGGRTIGAIGVSGASATQDGQVAGVAAAALR